MKCSRPWIVASLVVFVVAAAAVATAQSKPTTGPAGTPARGDKNPAFAKVADDPALPRVLLIGDSISIGYTLPTRDALKGKANVHRPPANCGPTPRGVEHLDAWLGDGKWNVIHFNFGLHDLKYVNDAGRNTSPDKGRPQVPP